MKALAAWDILQQPFVIEDVCFEADALAGMPGPYIKDFLFAIADKNITLHDIVEPLGNIRAHSVCHVAYVKNEDKIEFFTGRSSGEIVAAKGDLDHGKVSFNKVFKPEGHDKTYGEMSMAEHAKYSARSLALTQLNNFLKKIKKSPANERSAREK